MVKKIFDNQQSKLAARAAGNQEAGERIGLIASHPQKLFPKSFRLKAGDLERLTAIMAKLKNLYPDKDFGETDLIRGLLVIGERTSAERLLLAIRDARI